jgi:hypothetical protein
VEISVTDKEIIYTNGEVRLLIQKVEESHKENYNSTTDNRRSSGTALSDLSHSLIRIKKKYQTLSEVNLSVTQGILKNIDGDSYDRIVRTLFHEDQYKLPLLINDPLLGCLAQFRLQLGR